MKNKLNSRSIYARYICPILLLLSLSLLADGIHKSFTYSKIYYSEPEIIATQSETGFVWSSIVERQEDTVTAKLHVLNGCETIDSFECASPTNLSLSMRKSTGKAKIMLLDSDGTIAFFAPLTADAQSFSLESGEYQLIAIGAWFSGKIEVKQVA